MRRLLFLVTIIAVLCTAAATSAAASGGVSGTRAVPVLPGSRTAAGPTLSVSSNLSNRRYAASGDRAYDLGTEDGRYPAMGFHTRGEMGGIWTPPVKLLDGIWFGVNGQWIGPATHFTSGFGYVQMALPSTGGVQLTRTDFAPGRAPRGGVRADADRRVAGREREPERRRPLRADERLPVGLHQARPDHVQPARQGLVQREAARLHQHGHPARRQCVRAGLCRDRRRHRPHPGVGEDRRRLPRPAGPAGDLPGRLGAGQVPVR